VHELLFQPVQQEEKTEVESEQEFRQAQARGECCRHQEQFLQGEVAGGRGPGGVSEI
jgi:hypothetical protein